MSGWTEHGVAAAGGFLFSHTPQPPLPLRSSSEPKKLGIVAVAVVGRVAAEWWWQTGGVPFSHTHAATAAAALSSGPKRPGTVAVAARCCENGTPLSTATAAPILSLFGLELSMVAETVAVGVEMEHFHHPPLLCVCLPTRPHSPAHPALPPAS